MKRNKMLRSLLLVLVLCLLVGMVAVSFVLFRVQMTRLLSGVSTQNVLEVQNLNKQVLQAKFSDQFSMLEAQARYFAGVDLKDSAALKKTIAVTRGIGSFKKIAVANLDGVCTDYTGQPLANIAGKPYFRATVQSGGRQVSDRIELDENLEPILTLTYPLKRGREVQAVLVGTLSYSELKKLFSVSLFSGEGYIYIITREGNIILCNRDKTRTLYNVNFYDYLQNKIYDAASLSRIKADLAKHVSGSARFDGVEDEKLFTYAPLGISSWYIVSVLPVSYIDRQHAAIARLVVMLLAFLSCIIAAFVLVVSMLSRMNSSIEKDNERLVIANNQAQSLIFEYDIARQSVEFSGDTQFILGTDRKTFPIDFIRAEYYKRVHEDDASVCQHLRSAVEELAEDFSTEFRYRCFSEEFIWVRMTGSLITNGDGKAQKLIGSITNVNAQVMHEQELKTLAESDKLTGLLNKSAMEQKVMRFMRTESAPSPCALFIVDLDNFKQVNDTLGHLTGDRAIRDAAKKLSLLFSEKDFISRFGGDEFCILLRLNGQFDGESVMHIVKEKAQGVCALLKEDYFDEKTTVHVSASVGIAIYPAAGSDYETLFASADEALYRVKQQGKNGYFITSSS